MEIRRKTVMSICATALIALASPALAGPPLICHPFQTGPATLLPWGPHADAWNSPDPNYDVRRLTTDALALLTPDAPPLARMENLRRATIYASRDRAVAGQLLTALVSRSTASPNNVQALFDAAYLIEAYRQGAFIGKPGGDPTWKLEAPPTGLDGYAMIQKAIAIAGSSAELEFAASLMTQGAAAMSHRARAAAASRPGSLVAVNLAK